MEHRPYYEIYAVYVKEKILLDSGKAEEITEKYERYIKQIMAMNGGVIFMASQRRTIQRAHLFKGLNAKQKKRRRMELKRQREEQSNK